MTKGFQLSLTVDGLLARARAITGINIVDHEVVEPLTMMVKSLNEESFLHEKGAIAIQGRLQRLLCNRLRMQRDFAAHPEIREQKIVAPIVICGMGRTGSTKMQKLLAASGDFNWLPYWQVYNPSLVSGSREESPRQRIEEAEVYCKWFDECSPDAKYGHASETHEPDEESYMLEQSMQTACFIGWSELPSYIQWLFSHDLAAQFRYLLDLLKYLQWQGLHSASKRWLLKCPLYFGLEPAMLSVFPDAQLIMTHRHPKETIPSSCRLLETFHEPFTDAPIDYQAMLGGFAMQINMHLQVRATRPDIKYLDLDFREIIHSTETVIDKVYAYVGVKLEDKSRQRMLHWNTHHPMNQKGVHKYSLADFKLTEAQIETAFGDYIRFITPLSVS